ncbi:MAG: hypothetical protein ACRDVZ_15500 [Jiangellaceae bacterium]
MHSSALVTSAVATLAALCLVGCGADADNVSSGAPDGWAVLVDEPSGVEIALPEAAEPIERQVPAANGETVTVRNYTSVIDTTHEVGFNVLDADGDEYSLDAGAESAAGSIGGTLRNVEDITVAGRDAVQAEIVFGDGKLALFQLIVLDDHIVQPLVAGVEADREELQDTFDDLVGSVDLG